MTQDSQFNLSIESDIDDFDPLEDSEPEESEQGIGEFYATVATAEDAIAKTEEDEVSAEDGIAVAGHSAEERTAELFQVMAPRRKILLGILAYCGKPQPVADVNALVDELQEDNYSVYSAANLCALLEKSGALERVTPEGDSVEDGEVEPEVVLIDGVEYLGARESVANCWVSTEAGRAMLEADKPWERLKSILEEDATFQVIYKRILTLCAANNGAATPDLSSAVDNDPLVQNPRFCAAHFVEKLEKADAIAWKKTWVITEVGQKGLEFLADVTDEAADAEEIEAVGEIAAIDASKANAAEQE